MSGETEARARRLTASAAITSVSQLAYLAIGGILALGILLKFGKGLRTDGLFAAYGVYAFFVALAQSFRTAIVARLVEGGSVFGNFDRFLGAILVIFLLGALPLVGFGDALADVLTGNLGPPAQHAARSALAWFWLAAGAQLVSGLVAATLSVFGDFALPGIAYVIGGATSIPLLLVLSGPLGIDAVAVAIAAGSWLTAVLMLGRLVGRGYRTTLPHLVPDRRTLRGVQVLLAGSVGPIMYQLAYVGTMAFAARLGPGAITLYAYATFAVMLIAAATSGSATIVLAAPIAETWDRRASSLDPHLVATFRAGVTLIVPIAAAGAVAGHELINLVLGVALGPGDAGRLVHTFLALSGVLVAVAVAPVPSVALFAASRYAGIAKAAALGVALQVALTALVVKFGGTIEALGVAASVSNLCYAGLLLGLLYGRDVGRPLKLLAWQLAPVAFCGAAAFVPVALVAATLGGGLWDLAAAASGLVLFFALLRVALPEYWEVARRMAEPFMRWRRLVVAKR